MRGLPPLPADFISLRMSWESSLATTTNTHHFFVPGASAMDASDLSTFVAQWFLLAAGDLLSVLPADTSLTTCRAASSGPFGSVLEEPMAFNVGAFGSTTAINSALVMTWRTADGPIGGRAHSWLPLSDEFLDDNRRQLKQISYAECGAAARGYVQHANTVTVGGFGTAVFAVVHRSRAGMPLPASTWSPVTLGDASPILGSIRRRVKPRR